MFSDIKPWKYIEEVPSEEVSSNDATEPDPFDHMFDLSMLKPQSPFVPSTIQNNQQTFRSTELVQAEDNTDSPTRLNTKNYENSFEKETNF